MFPFERSFSVLANGSQMDHLSCGFFLFDCMSDVIFASRSQFTTFVGHVNAMYPILVAYVQTGIVGLWICCGFISKSNFNELNWSVLLLWLLEVNFMYSTSSLAFFLSWYHLLIPKALIFHFPFHIQIINFYTYIHTFSLNLIGRQVRFFLTWNKTWQRYLFCRKCFLACETLFSAFFISLQVEIWFTKLVLN